MFSPLGESNTELMLAVQGSIYGQALDRQIRYERYCKIAGQVKHVELPDEQRDMISERWAGDWLDVDVNNLQHNVFTAVLAQAICEADGVDEATTQRVTRALLVHDLKEYVLDPKLHDGDLTYDEAQKLGEAGYKQEHMELAEILGDDIFSMLGAEDRAEIVVDLNDSKAKPPQTKEGQIIEIAERLGYMHSALNAAGLVVDTGGLREQPDDEQLNMFAWMAQNVLGNHVVRLVELAGDFDSIKIFLSERSGEIDDAFDALLDPGIAEAVGALYLAEGKDDPNLREEMLVEAMLCWFDYKRSELEVGFGQARGQRTA